jgi:hypothetical protein
MSRSGYTDDCENPGLWRGVVANAIRGKRGQAFLRELAAAMDAMPVKELIAEELINDDGECCTIGVVCKSRGVDVSKIDYQDTHEVGDAVGIAAALAAEIEYENDECGHRYETVPHKPKNAWEKDFRWQRVEETPAERWQRMRKWVESKLKPT